MIEIYINNSFFKRVSYTGFLRFKLAVLTGNYEEGSISFTYNGQLFTMNNMADCSPYDPFSWIKKLQNNISFVQLCKERGLDYK